MNSQKDQLKEGRDEYGFREVSRSKIYLQSELLKDYQHLIPKSKIGNEHLQSIFEQNKILYTPLSKYEPFSFEVEESIAGQYKIYAKLGRFGLDITAIRQDEPNIFREQETISGAYGTVYFAQIGGKKACFKSFSFKDEEGFHKQFRKIIKEWSILRICSALQCGPYLTQSLGFDLVIFDDCVQYVAEWGNPLSQLTLRESNMLRQELALMHSLQIIHYDIKPENIIFSQYYGKPVFIDFGLSDIIEEEIGFKTFSGFRGTPNFCSQEMLELMVQINGYVDLFYNDAFALSLTVKNQQNSKENFQNLQIKLGRKQQKTILLLLFRFHYLQRQQALAKRKLINYLECNGNIKPILQFIKRVLHHVFLPQLFQQFFSMFKEHPLYQEIQSKLRYLQRLFIKSDMDGDRKAQFTGSFVPTSYLGNIMEWPTQNEQNFTHLYAVIMKIQHFQNNNVWIYLSTILFCTRFDIRNLSLLQKQQIIKKVHPLFAEYRGSKYQQTDNNQEYLEQIKDFWIFVFEFCLETDEPQWAKQNIFDILQYLTLLDADLFPYVNRFIRFLKINFVSLPEIGLALIQCSRFNQFFQLLQSQNIENMDKTFSIIQTFINQNVKLFLQTNCQHSDQQSNSISRIMCYIKKKRFCRKFIKNLKIIQIIEKYQK